MTQLLRDWGSIILLIYKLVMCNNNFIIVLEYVQIRDTSHLRWSRISVKLEVGVVVVNTLMIELIKEQKTRGLRWKEAYSKKKSWKEACMFDCIYMHQRWVVRVWWRDYLIRWEALQIREDLKLRDWSYLIQPLQNGP